jgi:hypothetical protein
MHRYELYQDIRNLIYLNQENNWTKFHAICVFSGDTGHVIAFNSLNKPFNLNYI